MQDVPARVYGVDFSGAQDAGKKIWIASGTAEAGTLQIDDCRRGDELPGSGKDRDTCLAALREFIGSQGACAFGLDFPFGLPWHVIMPSRRDSWETFVLSFPGDYSSPEEFRRHCRETVSGREKKRTTDRDSRTPMSPYNLRLYHQTYFGIRDVLQPLVQDRRACVLPMQKPLTDRSWVMEMCPASTLKHYDLYLRHYKRGSEGYKARATILKGIESEGLVHILSPSLRSRVLDDRGGDALDSVIGALATFRALRNLELLAMEPEPPYNVEGCVYV